MNGLDIALANEMEVDYDEHMSDSSLESLKESDFYKRHTCIICKRKRYERYMKPILFSSWVCKDEYYLQVCSDTEEIRIAERIREDLKKMRFIKVQHIIGK